MKTLGNMWVTDPSCCVRSKGKKRKKKTKPKTSSRHTDKHLGEEACKKNFSQIHLEGYYHVFTEQLQRGKRKVSIAWRILHKRCKPCRLWKTWKYLINTLLHSNPTPWYSHCFFGLSGLPPTELFSPSAGVRKDLHYLQIKRIWTEVFTYF